MSTSTLICTWCCKPIKPGDPCAWMKRERAVTMPYDRRKEPKNSTLYHGQCLIELRAQEQPELFAA